MIAKHLGPLVEAVEEGYGIRLADLVELTGGNDPFAQTFKATSDSREQIFVKQRIGMDSGISLCAALRDTGIEAVLAPIKTLKGEIARTLEGKMVLIYPYKEGHNGFERPLSLEHWRQIGESLRKIHDAELPQSVLSTLVEERFEVDGIPELERTRDGLLSGSAPSPADEALLKVMKANLETIAQVIRKTLELGAACREMSWDLVPCHADLHVGNVLVDTNDLVNLVDWDAPKLAPRECDLLFFCDGGILEAHGEAEEASFFAGYGPFEPNRLVLTYYQYARVLEDLVSYAREATDEHSHLEQRMEAVEGFATQFRRSLPIIG